MIKGTVLPFCLAAKIKGLAHRANPFSLAAASVGVRGRLLKPGTPSLTFGGDFKHQGGLVVG